MNPQTQQILANVQELLNTARLGLETLRTGSPDQRIAGFHNVVVFGRAVTNALQMLRGVEPGFEEWYSKYRQEMESDPLMKRLYGMRSEILKEGRTQVSTLVHIDHIEWPKDQVRFGPQPPNAKEFFMGDGYGGIGWVVQLPDGSTEKYYVDLPPDIGTSSLVISDPPAEHLGKPLQDASILACSSLYIEYLDGMVQSARTTFGKE